MFKPLAFDINFGIDIFITVTSKWPWWRLKSSASRLFTQPFAQAQFKENIKALRHWPLWGEFLHKGPVTRKMFPFDDVIMSALNVELVLDECHGTSLMSQHWSRPHFYQTRSAWSMDQGSNENHSPVNNFVPTVTKFCVLREGQALPQDTKFGNCRDKIVDSRTFISWSLIHGSSWSGLIKLGPGNSLVPSLPEPMLTQIYVAICCH